MLDYFDQPVAIDPNANDGEQMLVRGAEFEVFAGSDLSFTTPLAVYEAVSGAEINPLVSSSVGQLPQFRVEGDPEFVILKSGQFEVRLRSVFGAAKQAVADAGLGTDVVANVLQAAGDVADLATAAATSAGSASTAAIAAGDSATAAQGAVTDATAAKAGAETARDLAMAAADAAIAPTVAAVDARIEVMRATPLGIAPLDIQSRVPEANLPVRLADTELTAKFVSTLDAQSKPAARRGDLEISAREFGVKGDGTDETTALQAFVDYLAANGAHGVIPYRDVRISSPLVYPAVRGWKLRGMGRFRGTNLIQMSDNVPIVRVGAGGGDMLRDWAFEDICLTYNTPQPATNTSAYCLYFEAMPYQFTLRNVNFRNGYYGIGYAAGLGGGWGGDWDGIVFSGMSGGWYDMSGTINGVPNNRFGRLYGDASGATDYLFKQWRGYNTTVETIEIINYNGGLGLLDFTTQSVFIIGTFKLEGGSFTLPSTDLVRIPAGAFVRFGEFTLRSTNGGLTVNPSSGDCAVFAMGSGGSSVASVEIGVLNVQASSLVNGYIFRGNVRSSQVFIRRLERTLWKIANTGAGTVVNENIVIDQWMNKRLSANKGDASLTVAPGETEGTLFFETPLTAQRDISLPSDTKDLIGGLQYRVYVAAGVVNGTNYLRLVIPGTRTVYSKTTSTAEVITVEWRRNTNGANGWVVTGVSPA